MDKTGLKGLYGFKLDFGQQMGGDGPDLFAALQGQLGLKLVPSKGLVEILFVDHIEKPSGN